MVIETLKARRGEIAEQIRRLEDSLVHLDATIELFHPGYKPAATKHGDLTRAMLDVLRESMEPMPTSEVAVAIGSSAHRTDIALNRQRKKGVVRSMRENGGENRWEIVR